VERTAVPFDCANGGYFVGFTVQEAPTAVRYICANIVRRHLRMKLLTTQSISVCWRSMKELGLLLVFPAAVIGLLRTEVTPYRIVSVTELDEMKAAAQQAARAPLAVAAPTPVRDGQWMYDPKYRSALEKTTVVGVPEASKRREH
jgi:hypothetical protein